MAWQSPGRSIECLKLIAILCMAVFYSPDRGQDLVRFLLRGGRTHGIFVEGTDDCALQSIRSGPETRALGTSPRWPSGLGVVVQDAIEDLALQ